LSEPINVISLGAGVQSSTMALMAAAGELTPMPEQAVFADTGDEPAKVYEWLEWLETQLPFPVERVRCERGNLRESALLIRTSRDGNLYTETCLPVFTTRPDNNKGMGMRQCTRTFKIDPIRRHLRQLRSAVVQWIGISFDELHRMKPSRDPWLTNRWPLVDRKIRREDCLNWMQAHGYPRPPRSACYYCPYHNDEQWKDMKENQPAEFAKAVEFEKQLQERFTRGTFTRHTTPFLHAARRPLSEIDFDAEGDQLDLFGNECEGMCGV
jgi:hypothetical protein